MAWFFSKARIHKREPTGNAKIILDRLRAYLDNGNAEPVDILCGFWQDQQDAITYQELRELVKTGFLDEVTARLWQQDYSVLVTERLPKIWTDAMIAGSVSQPVMETALSAFTFSLTKPGVVEWIRSRGAYLVTVSTQTQKDAIALLLEDKMRNTHTVDELARLIRPCVGLTRPQTAAARNFYDNMVKTLTEQHPRTSPETLQARALDKTVKYAERLHRQRALTIAQTEMAFAYNYGADEGIRQAQADYLIGKCVKRWCTSGDDAVCEECDKLDGTEIGMEELFFSGNKVEYDESGLYPPLHPRCACAVEYIEVEPPAFPPNERDVTQEYLNHATPGEGKVELDPGYDEARNTAEIKNAEWLHNTFGGDIRLLKESQVEGERRADYLWNGKLWDLKCPTTAKAANSAIKHGLSQIRINPGGIILNYGDADYNETELMHVIRRRMHWYQGVNADIMIVRGDKVQKIVRYT